MSFVEHPRIVPGTMEERGYQTAMVERCLGANTLLILPTGLGKTVVAARVAAEYLDKGKVLVLAPTRPLVDQHADAFGTFLKDAKVAVLNGRVRDTRRAESVEGADVVVSTPQTVSNDLDAGRYGLSGFSLVIYDEAHRGRGDYDYVRVAGSVPKGARSVGMTASPGSSVERIEEVCRNLGLRRVDIRSDTDPDVSPYVHDTYVKRIEVDLPRDILDISSLLKVLYDDYYERLCSLGLAGRGVPPSKGYLISISDGLQRRISEIGGSGMVFKALTLDKICIQVLDAIGKVESEGTTVLRRYLERLEADAGAERGGRAARALMQRDEYKAVKLILERTDVEHPKVSRVMSLVSRTLSSGPGSKVLVFAQYRDACEMLADKVSGIPGARVSVLIGQSNGGLKQREQIGLLDGFRRGESNVLVSTSVGEEGLDVSNTDAVIFYEPVPSEIRTIQRRGRTGRKSDGDVYVLIARGSVDEAYERSSARKEQEMRENLERLSERLARGALPGDAGQTRLDGFRRQP